jgi:hypothetical protein
MANAPNLNPETGQVHTYNGPSLDPSWEYVGVAMSTWLATLPTSAGAAGTWWNNNGVPTQVPA